MRVHANFAEYVPFALPLIKLLELKKASSMLLIALCSVLLMRAAIQEVALPLD
jgi:uncharacterized membrane protein YecN with MAPEG domain